MLDSSRPYTFDRVVRMVLTALGAIGLFLLLRYLADVLVPFAIAAALAYFLNPLVLEIERRTKRRAFAVFYSLAGIFIVGFALILIMVPLITAQLSRFDKDLQRLKADLTTALLPVPTARSAGGGVSPQSYSHSLGSSPASALSDGATTSAPSSQPTVEKSALGLTELWAAWGDYLNEAAETPRSVRLEHLLAKVEGTPVGTLLARAMEFVQTTEFSALMVEVARRLAVGGFTVINVAVEMLLGATVVFVILLYLVFMLLDFPAYQATWRSFIPPRYKAEVLDFLHEFETVLRRYFRGQFIIAAISGVMYAVGFSIIGLPMGVPFGLLIGLLTMVPYLPIVALMPASLLAILRSVGDDSSLVTSFLLVGGVYVAVQIIQEGLIAPRVMGKATGLSPVAIILGLLIFSKLLGFLGLILAIPLTCLAIAYYRRFVLKHHDRIQPPDPTIAA